MIDVPIQVKDILRDGRKTKNFRINVLNSDGTLDFTIDNNTLVSETVSFDERMCSGDTIKFGLCEGSSLEFQYFNHPNITGRQLQVFIDIAYGSNQTCSIPMGYFTVQKCSRQASTGIIKATAYNKLKSEYLDQKANSILLEELDDDEIPITMYGIRDSLLEHYEITPYRYTVLEPGNVDAIYELLISTAVKLTDLTSDSGPINYYEMQSAASSYGITLTTNTNLYLVLRVASARWDIITGNTKYYQFLQQGHNLSQLIENFAGYVKDFVNACPLNKTGTEIINNIKNINNGVGGWKRIFGLMVSSGTDKYYNDYAYKYQNDGTYKVDGSTSDLLKQLIKNDVYTECYNYIPTKLEVWVDYSGGYGTLASFDLLGANPISYEGASSTTKTYPQFKYETGDTIPDTAMPFSDWFGLYEIEGLSDADLIEVDPVTIPDFTLRDIITANYETLCQFGKLDRETDYFAGVELNSSRLFPADNLYPGTSLYPLGAAVSSEKSMYSKLWGDEGNIQKWRYLIITYKGLDGDNKETDFKLQKTINADGTVDYNMSDNWIFKNLVWTSAQIEDYADAMVAKMQDVTWFPFEMWCAGLPYLETGDEIEITINQSTYTSYVLQRQLKGIQNLQDTYINGTLDIF